MILKADMAWEPNVRPRNITFLHEVPFEIYKGLLKIIKKNFPETNVEDNVQIKSLKPVDDLAGHFCLDYISKKWFLRILRHRRKNPTLEKAVIKYLSDSGIYVSIPVKWDLKVYWKGHNYFLSVFPFINGRHFDGSDSDLKAVASTLLKVHKALKLFKLSEEVRKAALKTAGRLFNTKEVIIRALQSDDFSIFYELSNWASNNKKWLKVLVKHFNPYICLMPQAQCGYGELHIGNVIFTLDENKVILTDLEEAPDSWFPPSFDLAYLIHRFCMDCEPSNIIFQKRLKIVKKIYGDLPRDLKEMMRQVCWYLIVLIIDRCIRRESFVPEVECDKFVRLERVTNLYKI